MCDSLSVLAGKDGDPSALDIYCRDFDPLKNQWQHMDEWLSQIWTQKAWVYELQVGHPCAKMVGTSGPVLLLAVRVSTPPRLVLDIQLSNVSLDTESLITSWIIGGNIKMSWICPIESLLALSTKAILSVRDSSI